MGATARKGRGGKRGRGGRKRRFRRLLRELLLREVVPGKLLVEHFFRGGRGGGGGPVLLYALGSLEVRGLDCLGYFFRGVFVGVAVG